MSQEEVLSKSVIRRLKHQQSPLIEKLLPYCQHKPDCAMNWASTDPFPACTCGLDEIRKELE